MVEKHALSIVCCETEWRAGISIEEIADTTDTPIDFTASFSRSSLLDSTLMPITWELQTMVETDARGKFDEFLAQVPDEFFPHTHKLQADLVSLKADRDDFEAWIIGNGKVGIFRNEIMQEIERR